MVADASADRRKMLRFNPQGARVKAYRIGTFLGFFGSSTDDLGGEVMDVSALGLRFLSHQKIPLNTRLKISLSFKSDSPLVATSVVKWAHPHTLPEKYVIGVEFEHLTDDQIEQLERAQKASAAKTK